MFDFSTNAKQKEAWLFLETVWEGLDYLYQQVERAERERAQSLGLTDETAKNFSYCDVGSSPGDSMVCNYFVWYANALSNFIGVFKKAFSLSENLEDDFANVIGIYLIDHASPQGHTTLPWAQFWMLDHINPIWEGLESGFCSHLASIRSAIDGSVLPPRSI
jgi:hypothetical protein